jgi:hypothetical protein
MKPTRVVGYLNNEDICTTSARKEFSVTMGTNGPPLQERNMNAKMCPFNANLVHSVITFACLLKSERFIQK